MTRYFKKITLKTCVVKNRHMFMIMDRMIGDGVVYAMSGIVKE